MKIIYLNVQRYKYTKLPNHGLKKLGGGGGGYERRAPEHNFAPGPHFSLYGPDEQIHVLLVSPSLTMFKTLNSFR